MVREERLVSALGRGVGKGEELLQRLQRSAEKEEAQEEHARHEQERMGIEGFEWVGRLGLQRAVDVLATVFAGDFDVFDVVVDVVVTVGM